MAKLSSDEEIEGQFLSRMRGAWIKPRDADEAGALAERLELLSRYHATRFQAAFDWLVENHKRRDWPTVSEIAQALRETQPKSVNRQILDDETTAAQEWVCSLATNERQALHWRFGKFISTETEMVGGLVREIQVERYYRPADPRWMLEAFRNRHKEEVRRF